MLKSRIRITLAIVTILVVFTPLLAADIAYEYRINGYRYSIQGLTDQTGLQFWDAATNGYALVDHHSKEIR
jgi:hypothetical protein